MKHSGSVKGTTFKWVCILVGLLVFALPLASSAAGDEAKIKVMTRNLYLGADIFRIIQAAQSDPSTIPFAVAQVYQTMLFTNFWARANAIADEIALAKPQVLGLQEVSAFYLQTPGDYLAGNPVKAGTLVIDFYQVLDAALRARGMYYQAFKVTNADVELPMADAAAGPPYYLSDVRMVDHDYILVRKGNAAVQVLGGAYTINLKQEVAGANLEFKRGYLAVDVTVDAQAYRFVSTHLEVSSSPGSAFRFVQSAQMQELLGILSYLDSVDPKPVIIVGDWNSSPVDVPGYYQHPLYGPLPYTPPYMQAVAAGYKDSWLLQSKYGAGYTSGFDELVSNPAAPLTERIDQVFLGLGGLRVYKVSSDVVGDSSSEMIPHPGYPGQYLWPSDHAGVVSKIEFLR